MENAFVTINNFGGISGLPLHVKKTKAVWLGKWSKDRSTPLQLTWTRDPVRILGIHFSYDEKQNNYYNFAIKIQKLQTNLDIFFLIHWNKQHFGMSKKSCAAYTIKFFTPNNCQEN